MRVLVQDEIGQLAQTLYISILALLIQRQNNAMLKAKGED